MKKRDCTIYVAKTKALINCVVTSQLICAFVFAYAKILFSRDGAETVWRHILAQRNHVLNDMYEIHVV